MTKSNSDAAKPIYQMTEQEESVITEYLPKLNTEIAPGIRVVKTDKGQIILPAHPNKLVGGLLSNRHSEHRILIFIMVFLTTG